jgi:hypothetical protein
MRSLLIFRLLKASEKLRGELDVHLLRQLPTVQLQFGSFHTVFASGQQGPRSTPLCANLPVEKITGISPSLGLWAPEAYTASDIGNSFHALRLPAQAIN